MKVFSSPDYLCQQGRQVQGDDVSIVDVCQYAGVSTVAEKTLQLISEMSLQINRYRVVRASYLSPYTLLQWLSHHGDPSLTGLPQ